ncbi:hypothetical protein N643_03230 [Salmonella bongori serovar 48:z41:-- str. RKS3044]|nr:hypothetical protein N643_03230 [Salmonella bongori serovar 48:z41:-- str. RKS3044]
MRRKKRKLRQRKKPRLKRRRKPQPKKRQLIKRLPQIKRQQRKRLQRRKRLRKKLRRIKRLLKKPQLKKRPLQRVSMICLAISVRVRMRRKPAVVQKATMLLLRGVVILKIMAHQARRLITMPARLNRRLRVSFTTHRLMQVKPVHCG